jgi:hypothetical protein
LARLAAFHDLEHHILEFGLPAGKRADLVLETLELPRRADLTAIEALAVACRTGSDLIHVRLAFRLLSGDVALIRLGGDDQVTQFGEASGGRGDLLMLGQPAALAVELVEARVVRLQDEQALLVGSRGVQGRSPISPMSQSSMRSGRTTGR